MKSKEKSNNLKKKIFLIYWGHFFSRSDYSCFKCATLLVATTEEKRSKPLNNRWKTIETSIRNIDEVDEKGGNKKECALGWVHKSMFFCILFRTFTIYSTDGLESFIQFLPPLSPYSCFVSLDYRYTTYLRNTSL